MNTTIDQNLAQAVEEALKETKSKQAKRLINFLLDHETAYTHEIAQQCAIGNISSAASYIRPALAKRGLAIVATKPEKNIPNRFGDPSMIHQWKLVEISQ